MNYGWRWLCQQNRLNRRQQTTFSCRRIAGRVSDLFKNVRQTEASLLIPYTNFHRNPRRLMFDEDCRKSGFAHSYTQEEAQHYLYFDHSDDFSDNPLSINESVLPSTFGLNLPVLKRAQYHRMLIQDGASPAQANLLMKAFLKNQRIYRRQKAKQRNLVKKNTHQPIVKIQQGIAHEEAADTKVEQEKRKKRLSAQISRDNKRKHLRSLQQENRQLRAMLLKLEAEKQRMESQLRMYKPLDEDQPNPNFVAQERSQKCNSESTSKNSISG